MSPEQAARFRFLQRIHDKVADLIAEVEADGEYADRFIVTKPLEMVTDYCRRELDNQFVEPVPR